MPALSESVSIKRRYLRVVNLERDFGIPDSLLGYIPTSRAIDSIERFLRSFSFDNSVRAWTLTGSYGTGKSAFANYLTAICAPRQYENFNNAIQILKQTKNSNSLQRQIKKNLPESGLIRAVATAQREPIAKTVLRALNNGASIFWKNVNGRRPSVLKELNDLYLKSQKGSPIDNNHLVQVILSLAEKSRAGILLIIDELGKSLEYSSQNQSVDDLYLLQQIAELPSSPAGFNVFLFGLLHQSFIDYAHGIATTQRNEWAKIQGRFEDIPFLESPSQMMYLIGQAIKQSNRKSFKESVNTWAQKWYSSLSKSDLPNHFSASDFVSVCPLHPLSALSLPILCAKYSQNDRTLFTFLASGEPDSFSTFLTQAPYGKVGFPSYKLYQLYDYFVESAGMSISARPQFQRWVEIQSRLLDASNLDPDMIHVLKTIGILNLVSTTGYLKASRQTVTLAMCDTPGEKKEVKYWDEKIRELLKKGFVTWRKRIDELRIWEGSDFDIEQEINRQVDVINFSLADLLNEYAPQSPLVAQRHSYETGTLRYFERRYFDKALSFDALDCEHSDSDGLICYWVGKITHLKKIKQIPQATLSGKPIIILCASELNILRMACNEYIILNNIVNNTPQLQTDGVARREVNQRSLSAKSFLDDALSKSFEIGSTLIHRNKHTKNIKLRNCSDFQANLSKICDKVYNKSPILWNELINRRELTAQGSTARNKLIQAMLENAGQPKLGISGSGPEYSMFESMLIQKGLYTESDGSWIFSKPSRNNRGLYHVWRAIESFCKSSDKEPKSIHLLYDRVESPPYGVKQGIVPVIFLAVLNYYDEYLSLYLDGTFIPVIGAEHFELLVKKPDRFSVKYFEISGLRADLFHELSKVLSAAMSAKSKKTPNKTILGVVKPLVIFAQKLPEFARTTKVGVTKEAIAVREALFMAKEPDELIFTALPKACGIPPIAPLDKRNNAVAKKFSKKLVQALNSLQVAYGNMLNQCEKLIKHSFAIKIDALEYRDNLGFRAMNLSSQVIEPQMKSFIQAASNKKSNRDSWLESLLLIISKKSPKSWSDEDAIIFETKLSDIARRFMNLEALQREIITPNEGIDARRITLTYPDGKEVHQMLWIDRDKQTHIRQLVDKIIENHGLDGDKNLRQAVTAVLIEKLFPKQNSNTETQTQKRKRIKGRG